MPKITVAQGPTNRFEPEEEEVTECPGNSSSPSDDSTSTKSEKTELESRSPAPTTENPSKKGRAANFTAETTVGRGVRDE